MRVDCGRVMLAHRGVGIGVVMATNRSAGIMPGFSRWARTVIKLLILLAVLYVGYRVLKAYQRSMARREDPESPHTQTGKMVRCAHCGVNLPEDEAIRDQGRHFCSEEHRLAHSQKD